MTTSFLGGGPEGTVTFGFVFSAAGSGVLLVVVLVALADALDAELLAAAVLEAAVAPADGAVWTPWATGWLLPQPATAAASASAAQVIVVVLGIRGPRVASATKKRRRTRT
ncbi:MAG TPA: hypothetical protein VGN28_08830 [Blastococcus sp.]|nr:hypothetical protein [Blastococcus sp.]